MTGREKEITLEIWGTHTILKGLRELSGIWESFLGSGRAFWDLGELSGIWKSFLGSGRAFWDLGEPSGRVQKSN
ncbi:MULTISPECIES: hypothetical protein [unclassified Methanosarcina]|uniref:hypothetical protein n=1 Tax=unclassified Methanosarcina TaxID=2644672 RepID=UPI00064ED61D|nr:MULTISPECIES: hypothetical protein [unclassified Methanosarcina]